MQKAVNDRELISALADGELRDDEFARALAWAGDADDARLSWHAYHWVGEVLRTGEASASAHDTDFVQRLRRRLQQEPHHAQGPSATVLMASSALLMKVDGIKSSKNRAVNDALFRWKALAGVASVALTALIGWQVAGGWGEPTGAGALAQQPETTLQQALIAGEPQLMIRDRQLDALLAAHKQFGGTSALQMPTGFLRNATFEGDAR